MKNLLVILVFILFICSCETNTDSEKIKLVYGTVVDEDGNPVADAEVCLLPMVLYNNNTLDLRNSYNDTLIKTKALELISFKASSVNNEFVFLEWSTASELNTVQFVIERTITNDNTSKDIGSIEAAGNSNSILNYSFKDYDVQPNTEYSYRLKIFDKDGTFDYSNYIVIIYTPVSSNLILSPNSTNPFNYGTRIYFKLGDDANVNYKIIEKSTSDIILQLKSLLPKGIHEVKFSSVDENNRVLRPGIYTFVITTEDTTIKMDMVLHFIFNTNNCEIPVSITKTDQNGKFEIPYHWFPNYREYTMIDISGNNMGPFYFSNTAKIVVRKTVEDNTEFSRYLVSQKKFNVNKSRNEKLKCIAKEYKVNK